MFLPCTGTFEAPALRGDNDKDAKEIGDASVISTSMGVPANIVWALENGVLVLFLRASGAGESTADMSVTSVLFVNILSPYVLTEEVETSSWVLGSGEVAATLLILESWAVIAASTLAFTSSAGPQARAVLGDQSPAAL
jgi:hypothetical protein